MVDMDSLKHILSGGGAIMLVFSILGEVIYSGCVASYDWGMSYEALSPGGYVTYWQLSIGITIMGIFAFICFIAYLVFDILELSLIPELVMKIVGLACVVLWFGMFVAECCAIAWDGPSLTTSTRKSIAKDEFTKSYLKEDVNDVIYPVGEEAVDLSTHLLYAKNINFDCTNDYDEYEKVESAKTPCIIRESDKKEICFGGWSRKKIQKYYDAILEKRKKEDANREKLQKKTMKERVFQRYSENKNEYLFSVLSNVDDYDSESGLFYSVFTSMFLGIQIIGIVLFAGSVVLGSFTGSDGAKSPKREESDEKNDEDI